MQWNLADDPAGNTPDGYTSWDLMVTTSTNLAVMEMILEADAAGDIYQDAVGGITEPNPGLFPSFPSLEFDTYVTMPPTYSVIGPPVDIDPASSLVFDDQTLSITWAAAGGAESGPGTFQVARVTLKDDATGTWRFMGWETGADGQYFEGTLADIPEPATLGLLVIGGLLLLRRRA